MAFASRSSRARNRPNQHRDRERGKWAKNLRILRRSSKAEIPGSFVPIKNIGTQDDNLGDGGSANRGVPQSNFSRRKITLRYAAYNQTGVGGYFICIWSVGCQDDAPTARNTGPWHSCCTLGTQKMRIDTIEFSESVLRMKCSGPFGIGSEGNPSGRLLKQSIESWITSHPGEHVKQIDIDYSDVEYTWGDGPLSSIIPFIQQGVIKIRLIGGSQNWKSLENLVGASGLPWVVVERRDA